MVGERIRSFRTAQKLSQEELALISELHPAYIGKVERGEKCPTIETLSKIAEGLKIPLPRLVDFADGTEPKTSDAFLRIQSVLTDMTDAEADRAADLLEGLTALLRGRA